MSSGGSRGVVCSPSAMASPAPSDSHDYDFMEVSPSGEGMSVAHLWGYQVERAMYAVAIVGGSIAALYTARKWRHSKQTLAARHLSYKASLTVADFLVLFVYAPTQLIWITNYWWHGGDILCRLYKFIFAFAFNLTGNMQVLIAFDRLYSMSRLHKVKGVETSRHSTRLALLIVWILAVGFALPQLFTFKVYYVEEDKNSQCVSIWHIANFENYSDASDNPSTSVNIDYYNERKEKMQRLETIYNVVHLFTMIFIPYALELLCYGLVLSFLSHAQKGEFGGLRAFCKKRFTALVALFHSNRRTSCSKSLKVELTEIVEVEEEEKEEKEKKEHSRPHSRPSQSTTATPQLRVASLRAKLSAKNSASIDLPDRQKKGQSPGLERAMMVEVQRRKSEPDLHEVCILETKLIESPWLRTVSRARRRTRRRAFIMLSCNLLFWLPYLLVSVASSLALVDSTIDFQFTCALVTFNAITNILL